MHAFTCWCPVALSVVLATALLAPPPAAKKQLTNSVGMKLVKIPIGSFQMGLPARERPAVRAAVSGSGPDDALDWLMAEEPQHGVEVSEFYLGSQEVTQRQFKDVMGYNPSYFAADGARKAGAEYECDKPGGGKGKVAGIDTRDFPVENVSWDEAVEFCRRLSELPEEVGTGRKYRLPTEAEWEYACRAGAPSPAAFQFGNSLSSRQANFKGDGPFGGAAMGPFLGRTAKVGSYEKSRFGLYDMHGNVWEWCSDWYDQDYYKHSPRRDPAGPAAGKFRVLRGGAWNYSAVDCRSANRSFVLPTDKNGHIGFRVALVPSSRAKVHE